ncbi:hypothetical protein N7456_007746 [Penicillium angulare]|uniref:Uncharacterized protein n=1 Tax=Penicillium angulare TaxID=116970 RepID=A0A9W9FBA0_9EURO|nr:hypothetical protein N7456_007746 [Penicillium angulare]
MMRGRHVQSPRHPIGLRQELVTEFDRLLYIDPKYDKHSPAEFTVKYDSDDSTLFTVTGKKYGNRPVREFRDKSGLPMFESERVWPALRWKKPWRVRLPGNNEDLVDIKLKWKPHTFDMTFRNALAQDAKKDEDKLVTLEVRRASALCSFAVYADGRKVADIRESVVRNRTISFWGVNTSNSTNHIPTRKIMDVLVADGFDLSLVSALFCYCVFMTVN